MSAEETRQTPEPDRPPMVRIFGLLAGLAVVVLVIVLGLWQLFKQTVRDEIYRKELSLESKDLQEARARDEGHLSGYVLIDQKKGVYQIPITRAMDRLLARPALLEQLPLAGATSPPAASQPEAPTSAPTESKADGARTP